jgi:hypothetical protein
MGFAVAVETKKIACAAGVYSPISVVGNTNVSFRNPDVGRGRLVIAASQPNPGEANFITPDEEWNSISSLTGTEIVYFMPSRDAATLDVVRG